MYRLPIVRGRYEPIQIGWVLLDPEDYERFKDLKIVSNTKYASTLVNKKYAYLHRLITNAGPNEQVDHINGDTYDCRRQNLRLCSSEENNANRSLKGLSKANTSYKGVYKITGGRWYVTITHKKKIYRLGSHETAEIAAKVYDAKAKELFGEFAYLNFPEEIHEEE